MTTFYVNASTGNDSNSGLSTADAWQNLSRIHTFISTLPDSSFGEHTFNIATGTYVGNLYFIVNGKPNIAGILNVNFEAGVVLNFDNTENAIGGQTDIGASVIANFNGNNTQINWESGSTANGIGTSGGITINADGFVIDGADDGISSHASSTINAINCLVTGFTKYGIATVNTSNTNLTNVVVTNPAPTALGLILNEYAATTSVYNNVKAFTTDGTVSPINVKGLTVNNCQFGTAETRVELRGENATFNDSFIHSTQDANVIMGSTFNRCFGRMSIRHRGLDTDPKISLNNCVFVGSVIGSGITEFIYTNFNGGTGVPIDVINSVITGYSSVLPSSWADTTQSDSWNLTSKIQNCALFNNTNISNAANASTVTNTFSGDPLLGSAITILKDAYRLYSSSAALTAGTNNSEIGLNQGTAFVPSIVNY